MKRLVVGSLVQLVLSAMVCGSIVIAQEMRAVFAASDTSTKRELLDHVMTRRRPVGGAELGELLRLALLDNAASVRERALLAVAARAGGPRFVADLDTRTRWREDRPALKGLQPLLMAALRDPIADVRHAAVLAIGNLEYDMDQTGSRPTLGDDVLGALAAAYRNESNPRVRTEIIKGVALSANDSDVVAELLSQAFDDQQPGVRQFAAVAAGRLKDPRWLDKLLLQLRTDGKEVRLASAFALASYGSLAAGHLAELRSIRDAEADDAVRKAVGRVIGGLERSR
jgi:HEAT repeat protein